MQARSRSERPTSTSSQPVLTGHVRPMAFHAISTIPLISAADRVRARRLPWRQGWWILLWEPIPPAPAACPRHSTILSGSSQPVAVVDGRTRACVPNARLHKRVHEDAWRSGGSRSVVSGFDPADPYSRRPVDSVPSALRRIGVLPHEEREFFGDEEYARLYTEAVANELRDWVGA